jgi:DNA-directed RNA polymerase subunit RPC12/RpoP
VTIQTERFTCVDCQNVFEGELIDNAPLAIAIAAMREIKCPKCGGGAGLGGQDGEPPANLKTEEQAKWWLDHGEHGTSSKTIFYVLSGGSMPRWPSVPLDPDDFRRCRLLLAAVPAWRQELHKVAERFPEWGPLVREWNHLDALFDEEASSGTAPKMYRRMKKLIQEGTK